MTKIFNISMFLYFRLVLLMYIYQYIYADHIHLLCSYKGYSDWLSSTFARAEDLSLEGPGFESH